MRSKIMQACSHMHSNLACTQHHPSQTSLYTRGVWRKQSKRCHATWPSARPQPTRICLDSSIDVPIARVGTDLGACQDRGPSQTFKQPAMPQADPE